MGVLNRETREIHAKIVYYGPTGSGKTSNVQFIHQKLKSEYRGELKTSEARDGGEYEFLPITLGTVRGYQTSIHIYTVPGGDAHSELRRQILDGADGIVFVADLRPEKHDEVLPALAELQEHLASYGRSFDDVIFAMQYNRRDQVDENALDALHRRIKIKPAASFETVASEGTGVLNALTTLSKQIISRIRRRADAEDLGTPAAPTPDAAAKPIASDPPKAPGDVSSAAPAAAPTAAPAATPAAPVTAPAATASVSAGSGFRVETAGPASASDGTICVPVCLVEENSGRKVEFKLRVSIET